jgi:hypothetical protein
MKRLLEAKSGKFLAICGIIALAAIIGFSFVSCDSSDPGPSPGPGPGPGPGGYDYTGNDIAKFQTWLVSKDKNTAANPYTVKLNISSLGGSNTTSGSLGYVIDRSDTAGRYVNLDLSGSAFTTIENYAFYLCERLTGITIPNSVTSIADGAFRECKGLTSVSLGNKVTSIGSEVFRDCASLTGITIPDSVTSTKNNTFNGCSSITSVSIGNGVPFIGTSDFEGCTSLTDLTIGNKVTRIYQNAFRNCSSLTNVTIPASVTTINDSAFQGCSNLASVTFEGTIPSSGFSSQAFAGLGGLRGKFYETNNENGTPGTYTKSDGTWTKQ